MRLPRWRFSIRGLMAATAGIAVMLALPDPWRGLAAVLALPCLAMWVARRLLAQLRRRTAGICFAILAIPVNVLFAASCLPPDLYFLTVLFLGWLLVLMPALAAFGGTWATLATRGAAGPQRPPTVAWLPVLALTIMPAATVLTVWPLRFAFLAVKPSLQRLADQAAAGKPFGPPRWVGPFRVVGSKFDPTTGSVAVLTDADPSGPTGFVRNSRTYAGPFGCYRPIRGDVLDVGLGGGWCYHEED